MFGGAHELNGDSIESSVFSSLSLSSKGSQIILELNYIFFENLSNVFVTIAIFKREYSILSLILRAGHT